jgi:glycosyltransferase involved in cell wall biosynthesis
VRVLEIMADGNPGGGTTHVLQILRGLGRAHSLGLVTQANSYLLNEARSLGIECFEADFFRSRLDFSTPVRLRQVVRKFSPELVHIHGGRAGFFYALAATKVPTIYTVHGYHFLHKSPLLARWLALNGERVASRSAERVVFVCNHDAKLAQAYGLLTGPRRGVVIYNGVPLEQIPKANPSGSKHIGFVGRLEYQKDPLFFLRVLERLPGYSATIVGSGALEDEVKAEIKCRGLSRVRMLGMLSYNEALEELAKLHAVVMTSRWEGLPHLPLEAMWCGVPVVATNVGGLGEVIESGRTGLLVDGRSARDLARAVKQLTEDLGSRELIIGNARGRVRDLFSGERMLSELRELYRQVATQ